MITNTLIEGLNEKILQAYLSKINVNPFAFPVHFPVKKVNAFTWKTLTNQNGAVNVAADVTADNASIQRKKRAIFQSANGDIPRIAIGRELKRSEIKEYQVAKALAGDANAAELIQFWADDVEFCFTGVQAELEFIAWSLLSNAGKLAFTTSNNAAVVTEFDLDYQVDDANKRKSAVDWATKATAAPIDDFAAVIKAAKSFNSNIKHVFVPLDNYYRLATCDQIIKACASFASNALGIQQTPDLATINSMLARQPWLNGLTLHVIDTTVSRELTNGTTTNANPFADNMAVFSETPILGSTQYDLLETSDQVIMKAQRAHTTVKKYSVTEPYKEVTIAEADAIPVLDSAYKNVYLKTNAANW